MRCSLIALTAGLATAPFTLALASQNRAQRQHQQAPVMVSSMQKDAAPASSALLLSDAMTSQRSLSIFASLARDDMNTSAAFADEQGYTIVLAPTNEALKRMGHKPWENPDEALALGGKAYKGETGMDRAERNLRRFVQGCLVDDAADDSVQDAHGEWPEGERRTRGAQNGEKGHKVWWELQDGRRVIMPEKIAVDGIASRVANGEVWALNGTFKV